MSWFWVILSPFIILAVLWFLGTVIIIGCLYEEPDYRPLDKVIKPGWPDDTDEDQWWWGIK